MAEPVPSAMSVEEFFVWQESQAVLYELVRGRPVPKSMTGATRRHDLVVVNAIATFRSKLRGTPCRPMTDDLAIPTDPGAVRRPDLSIDRGPYDPQSLVSETAVLVLEVLSPTKRMVDRLIKLEEYKRIATLRHILIANADTAHVLAYSRSDGGEWTCIDHIGMQSVIELGALGCTLTLADLYEDVPLSVDGEG